MKNPVRTRAEFLSEVGLLMGMVAVLSMPQIWAAEKHEFNTTGLFVEGCSCSIPCVCEISHLTHGCQGVGALIFTSGSYNGVDLAGAKMAYATAPGNWIRFYVEAKDQHQEDALTEFAKSRYREFGKVEGVKKASINVTGKDGRYTLAVDGGNIMQLTTEPVLGLDKKTPMTYSNVLNPVSPTVKQAKTIKGSFHDGDRSFTLEGSNAYFNPSAHGSGSV